MATHKSAEKAARQSAKKRDRNVAAKSSVKTAMKTLRALTANKLSAADVKKATELLNQVQRSVMKAASKNLIKKGTASRYISRLSSAIHRATA